LSRALFSIKEYVEDATGQELLDFMTYCYEQGLGKRSVYDKVFTVLQLFKRHGRKGLIERGDWPNYVETIRPVCEPEELDAMFRVSTESEATLLKFVLGSGFRDLEIRHAEWRDIDFRNELVAVYHRDGKALSEGTIPVLNASDYDQIMAGSAMTRQHNREL
jgi:integrase